MVARPARRTITVETCEEPEGVRVTIDPPLDLNAKNAEAYLSIGNWSDSNEGGRGRIENVQHLGTSEAGTHFYVPAALGEFDQCLLGDRAVQYLGRMGIEAKLQFPSLPGPTLG